MKQFVDKFLEIEKEIAEENGELSLFALLLREESQNKWDLVLSAPWISDKKAPLFGSVARKLRNKLDKEVLMSLSRIVLLNYDDPFVLTVNSIFKTVHNIVEIKDSRFNNISVKHVFIITSQKVKKDK